jgi:hypothetical protein
VLKRLLPQSATPLPSACAVDRALKQPSDSGCDSRGMTRPCRGSQKRASTPWTRLSSDVKVLLPFRNIIRGAPRLRCSSGGDPRSSGQQGSNPLQQAHRAASAPASPTCGAHVGFVVLLSTLPHCQRCRQRAAPRPTGLVRAIAQLVVQMVTQVKKVKVLLTLALVQEAFRCSVQCSVQPQPNQALGGSRPPAHLPCSRAGIRMHPCSSHQPRSRFLLQR